MADFFNLFLKPENKNQTEKVILTNGFTTEPKIFLNLKDLIKEFHLKEPQVGYLENTIRFPAEKSFAFSQGPERPRHLR